MIQTFRFCFQVISWDNSFDFAAKSDESLKTCKRSELFGSEMKYCESCQSNVDVQYSACVTVIYLAFRISPCKSSSTLKFEVSNKLIR